MLPHTNVNLFQRTLNSMTIFMSDNKMLQQKRALILLQSSSTGSIDLQLVVIDITQLRLNISSLIIHYFKRLQQAVEFTPPDLPMI